MKYKGIIRINKDLMEFFQGIICVKKIKDEAYVIKLDEYADVGTNWIALFCNRTEIFISIVLVLNMFLRRLKNLSRIKT